MGDGDWIRGKTKEEGSMVVEAAMVLPTVCSVPNFYRTDDLVFDSLAKHSIRYCEIYFNAYVPGSFGGAEMGSNK
ncbi:hypothetical protein [Paenibacillus sp.]|uniref:hypothetical protein n=1 Tax=Paenibacillus sp. TaxID=58172 RepID=UPI0028B1B7D2|nr:hypothetical protein [Paenibacillus sp.]